MLVAGGFDNVASNSVASAEIYSAITGTFVATGSMANPRQLRWGAMLADGRVMAIGGSQNSPVAMTQADIFDDGRPAVAAVPTITVPASACGTIA